MYPCVSVDHQRVDFNREVAGYSTSEFNMHRPSGRLVALSPLVVLHPSKQ
jgi:hypothetical protein